MKNNIYIIFIIVILCFSVLFARRQWGLRCKQIKLNLSSIISNKSIPFIFDADSVGIKTYKDSDYALEILSVSIDSKEIAPIDGTGKTSIFGLKEPTVISSPFLWQHRIGSPAVENNKINFSNADLHYVQLQVNDPNGINDHTYVFDFFTIRNKLIIKYKIRTFERMLTVQCMK